MRDKRLHKRLLNCLREILPEDNFRVRRAREDNQGIYYVEAESDEYIYRVKLKMCSTHCVLLSYDYDENHRTGS